MADVKVTVDGRKGFVDEEIYKTGDKAAIGAAFRPADDSAFAADAPGVPKVPTVGAPDGRSWVTKTGDEAVSQMGATAKEELGRVSSPGGSLKKLASFLFPVAGPTAAATSEFVGDLGSGKALDDYRKFFEGLPGAASMAVRRPDNFATQAIAGGLANALGLGLRNVGSAGARARGEKWLADTFQLGTTAIGAAPFSGAPSSARGFMRGAESSTRTPRIAPRTVDRYTDALDAAAGGQRTADRLKPQISAANRRLAGESRRLGEDAAKAQLDDAARRTKAARDAMDEVRMAKDDYDIMQRQRKLESVEAREAPDNVFRGRMAGAEKRFVELDRALNEAVDEAFSGGRLSRQQKIALYDALQGKRFPDDLPPDLLDLAEQLREARIDADRFRSMSLTDEVRDPMSQYGKSKTGREQHALDLELVKRRGELRRARVDETAAGDAWKRVRERLDPLEARRNELMNRSDDALEHVDDMRTFGENIGSKDALSLHVADGAGPGDHGALAWLARQPAEGALAKHIGPMQMKAAAAIVRSMADRHPLFDLARVSGGAYGSMPAALARSVLETHEELLMSDPGYAEEFRSLSNP